MNKKCCLLLRSSTAKSTSWLKSIPRDIIPDSKYTLICEKQCEFECPLIVTSRKKEIYLQFEEQLDRIGVFEFVIKIEEDFSYKAFHSGIRNTIAD